MILSLNMPKVGAGMTQGTIHRLVAAVGDELRPGVPMLEVRVDLESDKVQDCPPLYFFRIIATERGVLRSVTVAEGDVVAAGSTLGIVTSAAAESAEGAATRALRTTSVAIQIDPLSRR
jgi:pyruvate/2-oxoglutarate dehydrogenase complex dihydrolipoamide acyltransferase (E2) component